MGDKTFGQSKGFGDSIRLERENRLPDSRADSRAFLAGLGRGGAAALALACLLASLAAAPLAAQGLVVPDAGTPNAGAPDAKTVEPPPDAAMPEVAPGAAPSERAAKVTPETEAMAEAIYHALGGAELTRILAADGAASANDLSGSMFDAKLDRGWAEKVAVIYAPAALDARFRAALGQEVAAYPAEARAGLDFLAGAAGQRILAQELRARAQLLDPEAKETAEVAAEKARLARDARVRHYDRLLAAGDMLDRNVAVGLATMLAFSEGVAASLPQAERGAASDPQNMRADVWAQEPQLRQTTKDFMQTFAVLAYGPLPDADLAALLAYQSSDAGRAMNGLLAAAFQASLSPAMHDLGVAAGQAMQGNRI